MLLQIDDLYERRIDTWIRDFVGATHVLDVYRQKRVDKRKVGAGSCLQEHAHSGKREHTKLCLIASLLDSWLHWPWSARILMLHHFLA